MFDLVQVAFYSENENFFWVLGRTLQYIFPLNLVKILSLEKKLWPPYPNTFASIKGQGQGQGHLPSSNSTDLIHPLNKFGQDIL